MTRHRSLAELDAGLDHIRQAPKTLGVLELIVRRPAVDAREVLEHGQLDRTEGLSGDSWLSRGSRQTPDGSADPNAQLTIMSTRVIGLIAPDRARWQLAGDQLFVDFDLSADNLPPGSRLRLGDAVVEVSEEPHTGCKKFVARFGLDAMKWVNSERGRRLNLRGVNARVIDPGDVRVGDAVYKLS